MPNVPSFIPIVSSGTALNAAAGSLKKLKKIKKPRSKAAKRAQLAKNKAAGKAHEAKVKKQLEGQLKKNEKLLEQVTVKMPNGKRARPDFIIMKKKPPPPTISKIVDAKSGNAKLTPNQKNMELTGGVLVGKRAGSFAGTSVSKGPITIM